MNTSSISLTAIGDVTSMSCHSNLPYFFYNEGKRLALFTDPIKISVDGLAWPRRWWNFKQLLLGRGVGGYQYSEEFIWNVQQQIPELLLNGLIISFSQVSPRIEVVHQAGGEVIYYIDATLKDLVDNESYGIKIPSWILEKALDQERRNYEGARYVVTRSSWIISTLTNFYKIDPKKIYQIMPGANINLPENWIVPAFNAGAGKERPLVLGFVGKDWKRKGLPFLIEIRDELEQRGYNVIIQAVGNCPEELLSRKGLKFTGFIHKEKEMDKFVDVISSSDIGCLFSESEALGISTLEFLRVGVPVAGFYHQGLRDTLLEDASFRFNLGDTVKMVANSFEQYILDQDLQIAMKQNAIMHSKDVTWEKCVLRFKQLLHL